MPMPPALRRLVDLARAPTDGTFRLHDQPTDWIGTDRLPDLSKKQLRKRADLRLEANRELLVEAQAKLWANDTYGVLVIFQAIDAAGKDGTIKHVMSGVNPQGVDVSSFKVPSAEELDHNFLWRYSKRLPERGRIGIFNRSYYEEVLVVRVHRELLDGEQLPPPERGAEIWRHRYEDINNFELHLDRNGIKVVKFFLHLSKEEQRQRFLDRIDRPEKNWKFSGADIAEREYWDDYQRAFDRAIRHTSTPWAPWYVIPADRKWFMRALVSQILAAAIDDLPIGYPTLDPAQRAELADARRALEAEGPTT